MAAAPLIEKMDFSTSDPDNALEFLEAAYGSSELRVVEPLAANGVLKIDRLATAQVSTCDATLPSKLDITYSGQEEVVISDVSAGSFTIDHDGWHGLGTTEVGPGDFALSIQPDTEWTHHAQPMRNVGVSVSESLMREVVGADPRDDTLHWEPLSARPIPGRAELWRETTRFLEQTLRDPVAAESPLVVAEAERLVASAALTVFPNKLVERVQELDHEGGSDILRRAIAFIESNPRQDISLAEIATAAHSGPRAVQVAFRKHMNTTPMAYLRLVRLHHMREELLRASPADGTTVASVCARWGFANQGRCAELYRTQFGENPSATLRR